MNAWEQSTIDCPDCDGQAVARTNQWGETTHYECPNCGSEHDPEEI